MGASTLVKIKKQQSTEACPECGTSLLTPGSVIYWEMLPIKSSAHLEPGNCGVVVVIDKLGAECVPYLQCAECGQELNFQIQEVCLDTDCEEASDEADD